MAGQTAAFHHRKPIETLKITFFQPGELDL